MCKALRACRIRWPTSTETRTSLSGGMIAACAPCKGPGRVVTGRSVVCTTLRGDRLTHARPSKSEREIQRVPLWERWAQDTRPQAHPGGVGTRCRSRSLGSGNRLCRLQCPAGTSGDAFALCLVLPTEAARSRRKRARCVIRAEPLLCGLVGKTGPCTAAAKPVSMLLAFTRQRSRGHGRLQRSQQRP